MAVVLPRYQSYDFLRQTTISYDLYPLSVALTTSATIVLSVVKQRRDDGRCQAIDRHISHVHSMPP